jgi:hypothetical protein
MAPPAPGQGRSQKPTDSDQGCEEDAWNAEVQEWRIREDSRIRSKQMAVRCSRERNTSRDGRKAAESLNPVSVLVLISITRTRQDSTAMASCRHLTGSRRSLA